MSKIEKVIFDTNSLRNIEPEYFLGGRDELEKFSKVVDIVIPDMVISELRQQKKRQLNKHKDSFLKNPFHWIKKIDPDEVKNFDIDKHINELSELEKIQYFVIGLTSQGILEKMKEMALNNLPPFEEESDKGFKDSYIYLTILEYLQTIPDKYVFVCTKDKRLKEAFKKHQNIILVDNFSDYQSKSLSGLCDDYFLGRISEYVIEKELCDNPVYLGDVKGFWLNIEGKQVLHIQLEGYAIVVLVEDREIIEHEFISTYQGLIEGLIHSGKWGDTHDLAKELFNSGYLKWLSDNEIEGLIGAAIENPQISGTFHYTVEELYLKLYEAKKDVLPIELKKGIEALLFNS